MIRWFKVLLRMVRDYDKDYKELWHKADSAIAQTIETRNILIDRTSINTDVAVYQKRNTIIVTGNYKKYGYVETFQMDNNEFAYLVEKLKDMKSHGHIDNIDCPPSMKYVFENI